jgi:hypothetical protein
MQEQLLLHLPFFLPSSEEYFIGRPFGQCPTRINGLVLSEFNQAALPEHINPYAKTSLSL